MKFSNSNKSNNKLFTCKNLSKEKERKSDIQLDKFTNPISQKSLDNYRIKIKQKLSEPKKYSKENNLISLSQSQSFSQIPYKFKSKSEKENFFDERSLVKDMINNNSKIISLNYSKENYNKGNNYINIINLKNKNKIKYKDKENNIENKDEKIIFTTYIYDKYKKNMQMEITNKQIFIYKIFQNMRKDEFLFSFNKLQKAKHIKNKNINNDNDNDNDNEVEDNEKDNENINDKISFLRNNINFFLSKRRKIISLIRDIHYKLNFNKETFYTCVYYFDIICNKLITDYFIHTFIENFDFINLAISCLLISSKFCDNDPNIPNIKKYLIHKETNRDKTHRNSYDDFHNYNHKYNFNSNLNEDIRIIKEFEVFVLNLLEYKLNYSSPYHYIKFFYCYGFIFKKDFQYFEYIFAFSKEIENANMNNNINISLKSNKNNPEYINSNINTNSNMQNEKINENEDFIYKDFFKYVEFAYKKCEEIIYLVTLDEEFFIINYVDNYNDSNNCKKIKEYNSFYISCAVIFFCREIFFNKINKDKLIEKNNQKFEIWGLTLQNLFKVKFENFKHEYNIIKK
jgi:hypothetical protein